MNLIRSIFVATLSTLSTGCQTYESADFTRYEHTAQQAFPVSTEAPPTATSTIGIVSMQEDGFYLLGLIPVVRVSLQSCLDRMVVEAKRVARKASRT